MRPPEAAITGGRLAAVLLRLEARRLVAWISIAVAAGAALGCTSAAVVPVAVAVGGLLAVAAIGHLPHARACPPAARRLLILTRIQWPIAGAVLAGTFLGLRGEMGAAVAAGVVAGSVVVTAALMMAFLRRDATDAVAVGHSLTCVGLGAAAGMAALVAGGSTLAQIAATVAASGALAGSLITGHALDYQAALGAPSAKHRRPLVGPGPAMASALVAMAGCYFLAPQFAWGYALLAVGWFVAIAVPAVTPARDASPVTRLVRSAVGRPACVGSTTRSLGIVATATGLLAWPAVVAAVLGGPAVWRLDGPFMALAALAAIAGLTSAAGPIAGWLVGSRVSGEVARAIVLSAVAAAAVGVAILGGKPA